MLFTSELSGCRTFVFISIPWLFSTNLLFMGAVALVFAPLAPLVVLAGALVFWMSSWVYKYQLMFVYTSKVESGGVSFFPNYFLASGFIVT